MVISIRIITVKIPETYLEGLEELVNTGRYTSRSEAIRAAIRELLKKELWDIQSSSSSNNGYREESEESERRFDKSGRVVKVTL